MSAKLYFWYGAMSSGKSIELIKAAFNYKNRGMNPLVFNYSMDKRFGENKVSSRSGMYIESLSFDSNTIFNKKLIDFSYINLKNPDCIFIDEAQFLTKEQVDELSKIAIYSGIPVMCYGLKTNFKSELFEGSKRLLELAQTIEEIKTICWCQKKATMNVRIHNDEVMREGDEIEIGGDEAYESICLKHYIEGISSKSKHRINTKL